MTAETPRTVAASVETTWRRIDGAAHFVLLEQLCLSQRCGSLRTVRGNEIAVEAQRARLRLIVEVADEVWGGH